MDFQSDDQTVERRTAERHAGTLSVALGGNGAVRGHTIDIGSRGVLCSFDDDLTMTVGDVTELELERIGALRVRLVSHSSHGSHFEFRGLAGDARARLDAVLAEMG